MLEFILDLIVELVLVLLSWRAFLWLCAAVVVILLVYAAFA